jgi:DNA-binding SARP family transcriptional activator
MRCYAQQNQYHLALHQYQICVETLEVELGVAPAPATVALHDSLLQRVIS